MSAPTCIQNVVTNPSTGRVVGVTICCTCKSAKHEENALRAWLKEMRCDPRCTGEQHCDEHKLSVEEYQRRLAALGLD
jgi:hypothetical protein